MNERTKELIGKLGTWPEGAKFPADILWTHCLEAADMLLLQSDVIDAAKAARMMNTDETIAILDAALAALEQEKKA